MNMTEQDWEIVLAEHRESFNVMADAVKPPAITSKPRTEGNQVFQYIRIEKATAKAKFFVTHETLTELHGFWCPNAAIVASKGSTVEIQNWCTIKTINSLHEQR
jgi:hypothetical protein